ncbi:MAG: serine/threonine protein kinase [Betaproteobacteria bacterium]|nr:serine/threonine protein kinase [Betaproteobacteria bacterium]
MSGGGEPLVPFFQALSPLRVLDALSDLGLAVDGRLSALSSYENRVYLAMLEDNNAVVAKFYRPQRWPQALIAEEQAFALELASQDIPVVAPVVLHGQSLHHLTVSQTDHPGFWFSVSPRRGGRQPELDDPEVLEWIGRFLARIHLVGARSAFVHRPALDLHSFGQVPRQWLLDHAAVAAEVETQWAQISEQALALVRQAWDAAAVGQPGGVQTIRLHGDCHPGNILWTPTELPQGGPHFVDLDDARQGPAVQDLWMLQSGEREERTRQLGPLMDGYESLREFDRRELALIEPLRTLRLIHYSAWLAHRRDDPSFAQQFPWFDGPDYWRGQIHMLHEQIEAMQELPLTV